MDASDKTDDQPKYPHITLDICKLNGNAFVLIGATMNALKRSRVSASEVQTVIAHPTSARASRGDVAAST